MNKNTILIKKISKEIGVEFKLVIPERTYYNLVINGRNIPVLRTFSLSYGPFTESVLTRYKDITDYILRKKGVNLPKTVCLYSKNGDIKLTNRKLKQLKFPIIIKDSEGAKSKNVHSNVKDVKNAIKIIASLQKKGLEAIVQEMVYGKEFRLLTLGDTVIGALEMIPPRVFGNGKNTILELIEQKQKATPQKTKIDNSLKQILKEQGYGLNSVPQKETEIFIKKNSCLDEGGETRDMTKEIHPDFHRWCSEIAKTSGKILAGVDIITDDIKKSPFKNKNCNFIEINGKPDLYIHYEPDLGITRDVIKDIIKYLEKTVKPL